MGGRSGRKQIRRRAEPKPRPTRLNGKQARGLLDRIQKRWGTNLLDDQDWQMVGLILENGAITDPQLAKKIGCHRNTILRRRNTPDFKAALAEGRLGALDRAERAQARSIEVLMELMEDDDPRIRQTAALHFANRVKAEGGGDSNQANDWLAFLQEFWKRKKAKAELASVVPAESMKPAKKLLAVKSVVKKLAAEKKPAPAKTTAAVKTQSGGKRRRPPHVRAKQASAG